VRAQVRQPADDDRACEREQRKGAERGGRDSILPAEARSGVERDRGRSITSMIAIPAAANAYQRRKANIANTVNASAKATRRVIGATSASWPGRSASRRARRSARRSAQITKTSPPTSGMPRAATAIAAG
jgi:hypothetical protein